MKVYIGVLFIVFSFLGSLAFAATPTITSVSPSSGPIGQKVTLHGTNYLGTTTVEFNGTTAPTFTVVSAYYITAIVPGGATTGPITVIAPGGTVSSATSFTFVPTPTISSFTPSSGSIGQIVTLTGSNFTGTSAVKFNGVATTTINVVSATSITATVPGGATSGKITVTSPGGTASSATSFTVLPAPTIISVTPSIGAVGAKVTLYGTNFTGATAVTFNGLAATTFTVVSNHYITVLVPGGATSGPITVTTPGGTAPSATTFIPAPRISSFTPSSGSMGLRVTVSISGANFLGATAVTFNGVAASNYSVVSATAISAVVPANVSTGVITVTTPGGRATSTTSFTVTGGGRSTNSIDSAAMVWIPGGLFTMGCPGSIDNGVASNGETQQVLLTGYWIYKNEVTVAQYRAFCAATGHGLPPYPSVAYTPWSKNVDWTGTADNLQQTPIVNVSWNDAHLYSVWAGVWLPTEAQFEYAARGVQENNYPWGGTATSADPNNGWTQTRCANWWNSCNVGISTWPVSSIPAGASWCGALDLAGNVWEWCADWYGDYPTPQGIPPTPVTNPTGPSSGTFRVIRGGAWYDGDVEYDFRGAFRSDDYADDTRDDIGFRCVSTAPAP